MIKIAFFDIDGTLFSFKTHGMPQSTINALHALQRNGVKVFVASGRERALIDRNVFSWFDGFLTANGSECFTADGTTIYSKGIPREDIARLVAFQATNETPFIYFYDDECFITGVNERVEQVAEMLNIKDLPVKPASEALNHDVMQAIGYFTEAEASEWGIFTRVAPSCKPLRWFPLFADIVPKDNDKASGIDHVLNYYGLTTDEAIAFGDGGNDIDMLRHAGIGVAMGNARPEVKAAANYVTTSVDDDGIANALRHFSLI